MKLTNTDKFCLGFCGLLAVLWLAAEAQSKPRTVPMDRTACHLLRTELTDAVQSGLLTKEQGNEVFQGCIDKFG